MNLKIGKLALLFGMLIFVMGCGEDDEGGATPIVEYIYDNCVPLKKEFADLSSGDVWREVNFEYEEGRLSRILQSDGYIQEYEYKNDKVTRITEYVNLDQINTYVEYKYDENNQIVNLKYFSSLDGPDNFELRREMDFTYENGVVSEADMVHLGTPYKLYYYFTDDLPDSIAVFPENAVMPQRKEIYDWDGRNNEYASLNVPMIDHFLTPLPFHQNTEKITRIQYDLQGNLLQTACVYYNINSYNGSGFPTSISTGNITTFNFEYANCN